MNLLFLSLGRYETVKVSDIYADLLREFIKHGHKVYILSPVDKHTDEIKPVIEEDGCTIIRVYTGKIQKTNVIEKGINTVLIEYRFLKAVKKYLSRVKFDLVLYPTPPITFVRVVEYVKKRDGAKTYLLLKDIFPQNAVDLGMLKKTGLKGLLYRYFRAKEKKLYAVSDKIGCMSTANRQYVLEHNPEVRPDKVEVCANSIEVRDMSISMEVREHIRNKYSLPLDKKIFVYGGNLGKPQCIPFIIDCLRTQLNNSNAYFLIVGDGTEYNKLETFFKEVRPSSMMLMKRLPKEDYDHMIAACDVGLIFLDYRFTIPNFPSRLLAYMQAKLPVLACTDTVTDIGKIIVENKMGWCCASNNTKNFDFMIKQILTMDLKDLGENAFKLLNIEYSVERSVSEILVQLGKIS